MNREAIVVELINVLAGIPVVKKVFRRFKALDTIPNTQYPCVIVEEDLPEVGFVWKSSGFADVTFQVSLMLGVMDRTSVSTALTALDVAVKKALAANPTLSSTCVRVVPDPETQRLGTEFAPYGMSVRPVTILYEGSAANGY